MEVASPARSRTTRSENLRKVKKGGAMNSCNYTPFLVAWSDFWAVGW
jgi:hypothetical protein